MVRGESAVRQTAMWRHVAVVDEVGASGPPLDVWPAHVLYGDDASECPEAVMWGPIGISKSLDEIGVPVLTPTRNM